MGRSKAQKAEGPLARTFQGWGGGVESNFYAALPADDMVANCSAIHKI
jgi:hypothetical protein